MLRSISQSVMVACTLLAVGTSVVKANASYDVRLVDPEAWIDSQAVVSTVRAPSQLNAAVGIWVNPAVAPALFEGGFEFVIRYENDFIVFNGLSRGPDLHPDWEYFTFRLSSDSLGMSPRPLVRIIGIADLTNTVTLPDEAFNLSGIVATLLFYTNNFGAQSEICVPLAFYADGCPDNTIVNRDGDTVYIPASGHESSPTWDSSACAGDSTRNVISGITFTPGTLCINPSQTTRGDLNLNGIRYEISDIILFSRFFIYGPSVFTIAPQDQYQNSETDCDSLPGSSRDYMRLMNVVTGVMNPCDASPVDSVPESSGPELSTDDTLRIPDMTVGPGDVFNVDIALTNLDSIGALTFRVLFEPTFVTPVADTLGFVNIQILRGEGAQWTTGAALRERGVITGLVAAFDPNNVYIPPGSGPTIRVPFQVPHGSAGQTGSLQFSIDPQYPHVYNTLSDKNASMWKRPVLQDGLITVTSGVCACPHQGDMNGDGVFDLVDVNAVIGVLFFSDSDVGDPNCPVTRADVNADGVSDATDLNRLINYVFLNQAGPSNPCP